MRLNLLVTGVGGQGNILASDIVAETALAAGYDVKKTDTLGMAQRNGSVISHVRVAERVFSPLIKMGDVDVLLAFEKLEAVRWGGYLRHGAVAIVNNHSLPPLSVNLGVDRYPTDEEVAGILGQRTERVVMVNGTAAAAGLGNVRTLNILMLGCLSRFAPFEPAAWKERIAARLPRRLVELNLAAFERGRREIADGRVG